MMILFQDKIIYMPSVPPFSRQEKVKDFARACLPMEWTEETILSLDGTKLALCIGVTPDVLSQIQSEKSCARPLIILYFQGNASSTPPRLPMLSNILKDLDAVESTRKFTLIALSYRGYWRSSGRASENGIQKDATAALHRALEMARQQDANVLLWGQSIGAGIAADLLARQPLSQSERIVGLILETPFSSIRNMLAALYPQRWLPYRYLWPFLWNRWDTEAAIGTLAGRGNVPAIQIISAGKDEVVPPSHGPELGKLCQSLGLQCSNFTVPGALHHETTMRPEGRMAIVTFVKHVNVGKDESASIAE